MSGVEVLRETVHDFKREFFKLEFSRNVQESTELGLKGFKSETVPSCVVTSSPSVLGGVNLIVVLLGEEVDGGVSHGQSGAYNQ